MRSLEVQEEEQALRGLSIKLAALQAEVNAIGRQLIDRRHALLDMNTWTPDIRPSWHKERAVRATIPAFLEGGTARVQDVHGLHLEPDTFVRHVQRGWYGIIKTARCVEGVSLALIYLQRTRDGRPYRKGVARIVPTSELEHVYYIPFRLGHTT